MTSLLAGPALFLLYGCGASVGLSAPEVIQDRLIAVSLLFAQRLRKLTILLAASHMGLVAVYYVGARKPGDRSHSLKCEPASARRALRIRRWRSMPGGVPRASLRSRSAWMPRRCSGD